MKTSLTLAHVHAHQFLHLVTDSKYVEHISKFFSQNCICSTQLTYDERFGFFFDSSKKTMKTNTDEYVHDMAFAFCMFSKQIFFCDCWWLYVYVFFFVWHYYFGLFFSLFQRSIKYYYFESDLLFVMDVSSNVIVKAAISRPQRPIFTEKCKH